jgi:nucleoside-diphosphate-sugar epimerase
MDTSAGTVLLTGANGFVASHILAGLIKRNYRIVASVRSEVKAQEILHLHPAWESFITFAYISDITVEGAYDEIFKQHKLDYIIHNASPLNFKVKDIQEEMIRPAIEG